ncbi:glycosyltransferase [Aeromonas caviae]
MHPLVSVYIPTCNRRELLERAVNSVLAQTYPNVEIIISDDCSEDDTQAFCEELVSLHNNIFYLRNDIRSGACVARNKAINIAKGEFITGLDDDDFFLPERLTSLIEYLLKNNKEIVFSDCKVLKKDGALKVYRKKSKVNQKDLLVQNYIGNQVLTRTNLLREIGGFCVDMPAWQDLECWYRLLINKQAFCVHKSTYIMDVSHPHERITTSKVHNISLAFKTFSEKHLFNKRELLCLSGQMASYLGGFYSPVKLMILNLLCLNFIVSFKLLKLLVGKVINRLTC